MPALVYALLRRESGHCKVDSQFVSYTNQNMQSSRDGWQDGTSRGWRRSDLVGPMASGLPARSSVLFHPFAACHSTFALLFAQRPCVSLASDQPAFGSLVLAKRAEVTCARAHSPQCIFPQPHGCAPVIHLHSPHLPSFRSLAVLLSLPDVSDASTTTTDRSTCQSQSTSCCASILESTTACTCTSTELLLLLSCHPISHSSSH
jgi:hypothetical protein